MDTLGEENGRLVTSDNIMIDLDDVHL